MPFDESQPYDVVEDKPQFDPSQPHESVTEQPTASQPTAQTASPSLHDILFNPQYAQNLRGAIQDVVGGIPGMVTQTGKALYDAAKIQVGTPQQTTEAVADIAATAKGIANQTVSDVQSPLGSRENIRGLAQLGMMAAPAIGGLSEILRPAGEIPPVQAPITEAISKELPTAKEPVPEELQPKEGEPNAIEPSNAQIQGGETPLGVEERPGGAVPQPSDSDNVIREAQGTAARGEVPGTEAGQGTEAQVTPPEEKPPTEPEQPSQFPELSSTKNVTTDLQRAARNINPVEKAISQDRSATWDEATRTDQADPQAKNRLVDELEANPRAVKPVENDLLLRRQIELEKEHEAAINEVNRTKSPEAQARLDNARNELQRVYDVNQKVGTESGLSLNARKAMADRELNLSWMEAQVRAAGKGKPLTEPKLSEIKDVHDRLKSTQAKIWDNDKQLAAYKSRITTLSGKLAGKIEAGDLTKPTRERLKLDDEAFGLQQQHQALRNKFNQLVERERLQGRNFFERALNTFVALERSMKLTGITTLGKIGGAGLTRTAQAFAEDVVGGALSKIPGLSKIAAKATREGGFSLAAEKAAGRGFVKGVKEIPGVITGKISTYETRIPSSPLLGAPGRAHGALKRPAWSAEYNRSVSLYQREAQRLGKDPDDPQVRQSIRDGAKANADRAIFQNDNVLSSSWNVLMRTLESSKKFPNAGPQLASLGRFLLPIVRVPTNIALESANMLTGTLTGTGKLIGVMSRGLKNIKPEEAEMIMRHYKKGAVGAGLFLTGYFNPDSFGGFYQPREKREPGDLKAGEAKVAGVTIPWWLLHGPPFLVMQAGATARKLADKQKGTAESFRAVVRGIANEIPFVKETTMIDSLLGESYESTRAMGDLARSTVVPQAVQNVAMWTTEKDSQGNPVKRYPGSLLDYIKVGIPGLRESVPTTNPKERHKKNEYGF